MSDFRARMFEEHSQLSKRIDKLKEFVLSEKYDTLPEIDRTDLKKQLGHMERYFDVLSNRVSRQCNNAQVEANKTTLIRWECQAVNTGQYSEAVKLSGVRWKHDRCGKQAVIGHRSATYADKTVAINAEISSGH